MNSMRLPSHPKIVTVAEMQQLEAKTDAGSHSSYAAMMEAAGQAIASAIIDRTSSSGDFPSFPTVLILVGPGNNGGDALVCARHLAVAGYPVRAYLWRRSTEPSQDYEQHYAKATALNIESVHVDQDSDLSILTTWVREVDVVVDGLLGTGNSRPIADKLADILTSVKVAQKEKSFTIVAIDCPSGLYCDSGQIDPYAVAADLTVTFGYAKWGHYRFPGLTYCGEVMVTDIGIPPALGDSLNTFLIQAEWLAQLAPYRDINSHKGTFGKVLAAVGCKNYPGAAFLACAAAGRVGAGLITGAVASSIWPIVAGRLAEPTWLPLPESPSGHLTAKSAAQIYDALKGYSAFLLGCGLGQGAETLGFVQGVLQCGPLPPTVIDADGLNLLAQTAEWPTLLPEKTLLTPHPNEMSRLCGMDINEVRENRWALARQKAMEWNAVVLLKGPYTVIASPDGRLAVLPIATPALATAGTGDVLAGTISGLMAQGMEPFEAACLGAWVHGKAGERCGAEIGLAGVIASDLLARLPRELRKLVEYQLQHETSCV